MNEGEVVYASKYEENANSYAENQMYKGRESALKDLGIDDPNEDDISEADYQAGFDGEYYEVQMVDTSTQSEDHTVEIEDGTQIAVSDILKKLDLNDDEY